MMIDYNLILNEPMIDGDRILNYRYIQCVVITQFCLPHSNTLVKSH